MGRRRQKGIERFNISVNLRTSPKFQRLCRLLSTIDRRVVHSLLISFLEFVAVHRAFSYNVSDVEDITIADYCGWDSKDGDPSIFIDALKRAGFIWTKKYGKIYPDEKMDEGEVVGWLDYQPLVAEIIKKRELRETKEKQKNTKPKIRPDKSSQTKPNKNKIKLNKNQYMYIANSISNKIQSIGNIPIGSNGNNNNKNQQENQNIQKNQINAQIIQVTNLLHLNENDQNTIASWLRKLAIKTNDQVGWRIISEVKNSINSPTNNIRNPFALIIYKIKSELAKSQKNDSKAPTTRKNPKPDLWVE